MSTFYISDNGRLDNCFLIDIYPSWLFFGSNTGDNIILGEGSSAGEFTEAGSILLAFVYNIYLLLRFNWDGLALCLPELLWDTFKPAFFYSD